MCSATMVGQGVGMAGSAAQVIQGSAMTKYQQKMNRRAMVLHKAQAANAISEGRKVGQQALRKNSLQRSMQRVNFAKSGVSGASGSAARALQDMAQVGRQNAQDAVYRRRVGANNHLQSIHDLKSQNAQLAAQDKANRLQGGLSLLGGAVKGVGQYGRWSIAVDDFEKANPGQDLTFWKKISF